MRILIIIALSIYSFNGFCCSCNFVSVETEWLRSDLIVSATIIERQTLTEDELRAMGDGTNEVLSGYDGYLIRVIDEFKGNTTISTFWVVSSRDGCGINLTVGKTYLLYGKEIKKVNSLKNNDSANFYTGRCYRTKPLDTEQAQKDLMFLKGKN